MNDYLRLYQQLELPALAIDLASGKETLANDSPPVWAGFPPALLPLTSTDSGLSRGYWKHWFVAPRNSSLVEFFGQTMFSRPLLVMEIARDFTQFLYVRILVELSCFDLSARSAKVATRAGLDLDWLQALAAEAGDDLEALRELDCFRDPPQSCFGDLSDYHGDFPKPGMEQTPGRLQNACGYEIHGRFENGKPNLKYRQLVPRSPLRLLGSRPRLSLKSSLPYSLPAISPVPGSR